MSGTFDCIKNGEPSDKEEENKMFNTCGTSEKPIVMAKFVADGAEDGYVTMTMLFTFVRPKSVKAKKRPDMTVKPDLDKLCRTVLDALTGVAYKDDSQVIGIIANKRYGEVEMLHVKVVSG